MILWIDRETFCNLDLKEVGTYRYAEKAEDLLLAYAIDDEPAQVWDCTEDPYCPDDLHQALIAADEVWAHNAAFDKAIHKHQPLPPVELERWRCSMAQALSHALPAGLADLCEVLGVPEDLAKHKEGKKLLNLFTKPLPANRKLRRATRHTHPEEWKRFKAYAANDIEAMRECVRLMPRWNWQPNNIAEWHMDQRINERGFQVDRELTQAGAAAATTEKERIGERFRELTDTIVDRPSQRAQFMDFLKSRHGVIVDNTTKDNFEHLIKSGQVTGEVKELMELSMAANKTSTAKYAALEPMIQDDGRFRGALQFAGAGRTRRWAGRGPQFHNLPARGLPPARSVELYIECLKAGTYDLIFADLMKYGAAALRGVVIAMARMKLVAADLSNIEGRVLAWVAQEMWKLDAFRAYDAGTGPDLYNITAVSIIGGDPWHVPKKERNVFGKVPDLASGYQGGVAGYQKFAHAYGVRMEDHWGTIQKMIKPEFVDQAWLNIDKWGRPQVEELEISELEWVASETCKLAWRARHPRTVGFWRRLQDAMKAAINNPGMVFRVDPFLKVKRVSHMGQSWLVIRLPSGNYLTYFEPFLTDQGDICYYGEAAEEGKTTRQWVRIFTHGGKATGNVCQTISRDILAPALLEAETQGYLPILSVHDEGVCEVPDNDQFTHEGLAEILAANSDWNKGLPLAAAGFTAYRYKKED